MTTTKELRDIVAQAYNGLITDAELLLKLQLPPEVVPRVIAWSKLPIAAFDKIDLGDLFGSDGPRDAPISEPACDDDDDPDDDQNALVSTALEKLRATGSPSLSSVNIAGTPFGLKMTERLGFGINGDWKIIINGRPSAHAEVRLGTHAQDKWFCAIVRKHFAHRGAAVFKPDGALSSVAITAQNFFAFFDSPVIDDLWPQPGQTLYLTYKLDSMVDVGTIEPKAKPVPPVPVAKLKKTKPGTPIVVAPLKVLQLDSKAKPRKRRIPDSEL